MRGIGRKHRLCLQVGAGWEDLVQHAQAIGLWRRHMTAGDDQIQRFGRADQAWQPLRTATAGQQTQCHFRQTNPRIGESNTVVTAQRHLIATAQRKAGYGRDNRLGGLLQRVLRPHGQLGAFLAEKADVRASDELAVGPDQDDGLDVIGCIENLDAVQNAFGHAGRKRIHWRIVDRDDANGTRYGQANEVLRHTQISLEPAGVQIYPHINALPVRKPVQLRPVWDGIAAQAGGAAESAH
jgi:hypothetical protein